MMKHFSNISVGILALQGDFQAHQVHAEKIGCKVTLVKLPDQLHAIDALILPGGESTTMDKLMDIFALRKELTDFAKTRPIFGTCAGMILLAKEIEDNQAGVTPLKLLDIDVVRNGYGRQVFSFDTDITAILNGKKELITASFIRAPKIVRLGADVEILANYEGDPVLIKERRILAASFHAELSESTVLLEYFLNNFL